MLVLSRKQDQSVHFPNLGIKVEILSVNGKTVKVGVDAPREIAVLRGEIAKAQEQQSSQGPVANESTSNESTSNESKQKGSQERHELRNRLHTAKLALHMLQRQLDLGDSDRAEKSLTRALTALGRLDEMAAGPVSVRKDLGKEGACRAPWSLKTMRTNAS